MTNYSNLKFEQYKAEKNNVKFYDSSIILFVFYFSSFIIVSIFICFLFKIAGTTGRPLPNPPPVELKSFAEIINETFSINGWYILMAGVSLVASLTIILTSQKTLHIVLNNDSFYAVDLFMHIIELAWEEIEKIKIIDLFIVKFFIITLKTQDRKKWFCSFSMKKKRIKESIEKFMQNAQKK